MPEGGKQMDLKINSNDKIIYVVTDESGNETYGHCSSLQSAISGLVKQGCDDVVYMLNPNNHKRFAIRKLQPFNGEKE